MESPSFEKIEAKRLPELVEIADSPDLEPMDYWRIASRLSGGGDSRGAIEGLNLHIAGKAADGKHYLIEAPAGWQERKGRYVTSFIDPGGKVRIRQYNNAYWPTIDVIGEAVH